ncbi:MAG: Gfo/Idh/MocA family oxidoreductase [Pirellulaceae bacterium]|jgi:predicted dehydrogenase|nr:Gfo/Idh/MocA family oxidoreductase [Pirellulaceae bacterium]MDP7020575.1 Gfo/Idh/MocA family oxidoreductase [Pirellulaceae bacterium]
MNDIIRLAFVGIDNPHGAGWRDLLLNFTDQARIVELCPGYDGTTYSLEERYADLPIRGDVDELLKEGEFDAAVVCLPNDQGPAAIKRLASHGKHVLCEKPIAASGSDAAGMCKAIKKSGVAFQSGYTWRYDDLATRLRRMIDEERFGKLIHIDMSMITSDVRRRGPDHYLFDAEQSQVGFFNWLGCHYLDLLFYLTSCKVVGVTARTGVFGAVDADVEDGGSILIDLDDGCLVTFTGGYWIPRWAGENRVTIRGSQRWAHWDPARKGTDGALEIHGPQPQWYAMEDDYELSPDDTPGYGGVRGVRLVQDWLDVIRGESKRCRNTPASTLATLKLLDAAYKSSSKGQRVACSIS